MLSVGSLFAGIGGLELGLEMTGGFHTVWQAEKDEFARRVLAKHWPHARRFDDVRNITAQSVPRVDVLAGGFPCQPHSLAGSRLSSADERDLWGEFARIIGEIRPRWVVAENVPGLLSSADPAYGRGKGGFFGRVLRDLAERGYDAEWRSLTAASVGAHHKRARVFLIAHSNSIGSIALRAHGESPRKSEAPRRASSDMADADSERPLQSQGSERHERGWTGDRSPSLDNAFSIGRDTGRNDHGGHDGDFPSATGQDSRYVADAQSIGQQAGRLPLGTTTECASSSFHGGYEVGNPASERLPDWAGGTVGQPSPLTEFERPDGREVERDFCGVAHGVSLRVDRLRTLGNAVVPKVAQIVGQAILEAEAYRAAYGVMPDQIVQAAHISRIRA